MEKNNAVRKVPASEMEAAELTAIRAAGFEDASELLSAYTSLESRHKAPQAELLADRLNLGGKDCLPDAVARRYMENTGREPNELNTFWFTLLDGKKILVDNEIVAIGNYLLLYTPLEDHGRKIVHVDNIVSIDFSF